METHQIIQIIFIVAALVLIILSARCYKKAGKKLEQTLARDKYAFSMDVVRLIQAEHMFMGFGLTSLFALSLADVFEDGEFGLGTLAKLGCFALLLGLLMYFNISLLIRVFNTQLGDKRSEEIDVPPGGITH